MSFIRGRFARKVVSLSYQSNHHPSCFVRNRSLITRGHSHTSTHSRPHTHRNTRERVFFEMGNHSLCVFSLASIGSHSSWDCHWVEGKAFVARSNATTFREEEEVGDMKVKLKFNQWRIYRCRNGATASRMSVCVCVCACMCAASNNDHRTILWLRHARREREEDDDERSTLVFRCDHHAYRLLLLLFPYCLQQKGPFRLWILKTKNKKRPTGEEENLELFMFVRCGWIHTDSKW